MSEKSGKVFNVNLIKAREALIGSSQLNSDYSFSDEWLEPPQDMRGLKHMVEHSSILPQCIRAYKNNIAGYGLSVRYKEDYKTETPEMIAEYEKAKDIINLLNIDMDPKSFFEQIIENRETYGTAYAEVIRNALGEVAELVLIKDVASVRKTVPLEPYVDFEFQGKNGTELRKKKFRKYKQSVGGKDVFFREFGDTRAMDRRDGHYANEDEKTAYAFAANEILEFPIGTSAYGEVRYLGQCLGIDGSRRAEILNNKYFSEGRHTPMMIVLKGGTLSSESYTRLQEYMEGIKGDKGQHAFMILEAENSEGSAGFEVKQPEVEIKDLGSVLQKDELFQDYLENNRRRVQSAFQLPDLYVGYTSDFNRATAMTALEITEKQVFQPERKSLAWIINNKLLGGYNFKYVEAYFLEPNITNMDDFARILNITERAGGLTPNKAKEIIYSLLGAVAEDFPGEWGNLPLVKSGE